MCIRDSPHLSARSAPETISTAKEPAQVRHERLIDRQYHVVDAGLLQFAGVSDEPAAATVSDKGFAGLGFFGPENTAAQTAFLGWVAQLQHYAIVLARKRFEGRQRMRIVQIA